MSLFLFFRLDFPLTTIQRYPLGGELVFLLFLREGRKLYSSFFLFSLCKLELHLLPTEQEQAW